MIHQALLEAFDGKIPEKIQDLRLYDSMDLEKYRQLCSPIIAVDYTYLTQKYL
jgi:hypothetical protein